MKKTLCMLLAALGIALGGTVVTVMPIYSHVQVAEAAPVVQSAPVLAPQIGGVQPTWRYVSCYLAMDGATYCWRYACTYFEKVVLGCRDGWYRVTIWYA
jgi:hypothetical protein